MTPIYLFLILFPGPLPSPRQSPSGHLVYPPPANAGHTLTQTQTTTQSLFLSFIVSPARAENEFCIVMLHLPSWWVIRELLKGDACLGVGRLSISWNAELREGALYTERQCVLKKRRKKQNCCLENRNVSLMRKPLADKTLRKRIFEAIVSEQLYL